MEQTQRVRHTGNTGLFIVVAVVYTGILILFGWQTWGFVNWLFPSDQLLMQVLTMLCFDVMAAIWAVIDLFYHHATRGSRSIVRWGWAISFILSLLASVLYLVIQSFTRFSVTPSASMVNTGYTVTIIAITLTMLLVTFWLYSEWSVRHPHADDFVYEYERPRESVTLPQTGTIVQPVSNVPVSQQAQSNGGILSKIGGLFGSGNAVNQVPASLPPVSNAPKFIGSTVQVGSVARPRPHHRRNRVAPVVGNGATQAKNVLSSANAKRVKRGASTQTK